MRTTTPLMTMMKITSLIAPASRQSSQNGPVDIFVIIL